MADTCSDRNSHAPRCIRGLAGSGKTIVLALKASYLHALHPDWTIAITFHTRYLYQQFKNLVTNFYFYHVREEPNWGKLKILHSWGTRSEPGVYAEIALAYGQTPQNFGEAKMKHGQPFAFSGICDRLIKALGNAKRLLYMISS